MNMDQYRSLMFLFLSLAVIFAQDANASTTEAESLNDPTIQCDVDRGARVYNACRACHSLEPDKHLQGPTLYGLFSRKIGEAEGFVFSPAMRTADFPWNEETFNSFIKEPMVVVKGTTMPFGGIRREQQRIDLYCYLRSMDPPASTGTEK